MPKAETEATIVVPRVAVAEAIEILTGAMQQSFDVSSAAHLPAGLDGPEGTGSQDARTLIRLEGFEASVQARIDHAMRFVSGHGGVEVVTGDASRSLWQWMARIHALGPATPVLWRLSVPPASAARVSETIRAALAAMADTTFAYDWSGGLIWLWLDGGPVDLGASAIRAAIAANGGGHATLTRAPFEARGRVDVFEPQPPALAALNARLKNQFDPEGILNPGRMVGVA
jgi:glycolate oxidase FAD binding subunit